MATGVDPDEEPKRIWAIAMTHQSHIETALKRLERFQDNHLDYFQQAEKSMEHFRLQCMKVYFLHYEFAQEVSVLPKLWDMQVKVNQAYRQTLEQIGRGPRRPVTRNSLKNRYLSYLQTAQKFYQGFIQRLASRYTLPQIEEVCRSFGLSPLHLEKDGHIDAVATGVAGSILEACYDALVHLGDLSRYRYQQWEKGFEVGLGYYGLAQRLDPDNGVAHNQMAILYGLHHEDRHLDVIYHFYRSETALRPHAAAPGNLKRKFVKILKDTAPVGNQEQVLQAWFVRLHAIFYCRKKVDEREELEDEVMHRLRLAWKRQDNYESMLRLLVVNFLAYHVAVRTNQSSQEDKFFMQSTLRFIVRVISALSETIHAEITSLADDQRRLSSDGTTSAPDTFPSLVTILLPLFRITCGWMVYHHETLVANRDMLVSEMEEMYRHFARAQSALSNMFYKSCKDAADISPYLLSEDLELCGCLPLDNPAVFYAVRFQFDKEGARKPRPTEDTQVPSTKENWWRVRDILNCGLFLVGREGVPLKLSAAWGQSEMKYAEDVDQVGLEPQTSSVQSSGAFDEALEFLRAQSKAENLCNATRNINSASSTGTGPLFGTPPVAFEDKNHRIAHTPDLEIYSSVSYQGPIPTYTAAPQPGSLTYNDHIVSRDLGSSSKCEEVADIIENNLVHMVDDLLSGSISEPRIRPSQPPVTYTAYNTITETSRPSPTNSAMYLGSGAVAAAGYPQPWGAAGLSSPHSPYFSGVNGNPNSVFHQVYGASSNYGGSARHPSVPGWTIKSPP